VYRQASAFLLQAIAWFLMTQSNHPGWHRFLDTPPEVAMEVMQRERRKHPRYRMNRDVLSLNRDILAEVVNISASGMSGRCLTSVSRPLSAITEIDILNCERGTSVEGLPCRMVRSSERSISEALTSTKILNFSLEFHYLTDNQCLRLNTFIKDNHLVETSASPAGHDR
jgi:hypothetical protein